MTRSRKPAADIESPLERESSLTEAILRMSASLDLDTVLSEAVDGARGLTGARLGMIATVDDAGAPGDFIYSGFTPEESRELGSWPDRGPLFEHLRGLPTTLRVPDLADYVRSLGLSPTPTLSRAFQGTPMHYRGVNVGNFFLAEKVAGAEFTDGDEAVLMLFASQAAAAIANARTHRDERHARADLEALVETSPVGVVVFEGSGRPLSLNREARRIVENLRMPGHPTEQLLEVIACRRADGRQVSLAEFPLAQQFIANPETVRAEEMVLSVPDGRSIRTLINCTPIPAEEDELGSVVVTMQDLAPIDEIERMRTEFLGLVSHELRAPLTAIKGSGVTLLEEASDLDPAEVHEFSRIIVEQADLMRALIADLLDAGRIDSGTLSVTPEPSEVADLVERARDTFIGGGGSHGIVVDLPAGLPRVLADRRRIAQVLNNLFANAVRHAPQSMEIRVAAAREETHVAILVSDDGPGVPAELLPHLFRKHVGGGAGGTAGHGLGLAICKGLVEAHGGRIRAESNGPGEGTTITFTIPVAGEPVDAGRGPASTGSPSAGERPRILVVDDDPRTLRFVRDALSKAGYAPLVTAATHDLSRIIRAERPRLVLLDLMLPGINGIEMMRQIPELSDVPVIFISGYGRDETVARAFESGAVDYIVKPFSPTELVARVRAALRRYEEPLPFTLGDLAVHFESRQVTVAGRSVDLTATEYELLRVLALNAGRVVHYDTLLRQVWSGRSSADTNLVRIFVKSLRDKLGDSATDPTWIFNERGVGYRMPKPDDG
ncbi:MAG: response regulator [Gammaproteobacteria bacterium]|nr:response regulator [Gammaproteobacteria bacterium]